MKRILPPSRLETVAGNVGTESALTLVGAFSGNPLAALLPVLSKSLASERQRKRVEAALTEISQELENHSDTLRNLSDSQYKLINESILALLHTTNAEKLNYLRKAVRNVLEIRDLQPEESVFLSRIIRDISAEEAEFLLRNFSYKRIQLGVASGDTEHQADSMLVVEIGGKEELVVSGLMSLGLVVQAGPTFDDSGLLRFSNAVAKLIALLQVPAPTYR